MLRMSNCSSSVGNHWHFFTAWYDNLQNSHAFQRQTGSMIKNRGSIIKYGISVLGSATSSPGNWSEHQACLSSSSAWWSWWVPFNPAYSKILQWQPGDLYLDKHYKEYGRKLVSSLEGGKYFGIEGTVLPAGIGCGLARTKLTSPILNLTKEERPR